MTEPLFRTPGLDGFYARALYSACSTILVCGSRTMTQDHLPLAREELKLMPPQVLILHGNQGKRDARGRAISGADILVGDLARSLGHTLHIYPADWLTFGAAAGPIRNTAMLDTRPDLVLAFWDGQSRGTLDTMKKARERGIPVRVIEIDG